MGPLITLPAIMSDAFLSTYFLINLFWAPSAAFQFVRENALQAFVGP